LDPKSDKYSSWNGFNYALDNPIKFIDPDGKDIVLGMKNNDTRINILNHLRSLTTDKLDVSEDGRIHIVQKNHSGKREGRLLIRNLIEGVRQKDGSLKIAIVTIKEASGNGANPADNNGNTTDESIENSRNGTGTGTLVLFNPTDQGTRIVNEDGSTGRPPSIGLAHELIHAENNLNGTNTRHIPTNIPNPDPGASRNLSDEERKVRKRENLIRRENNVVDRKVID